MSRTPVRSSPMMRICGEVREVVLVEDLAVDLSPDRAAQDTASGRHELYGNGVRHAVAHATLTEPLDVAVGCQEGAAEADETVDVGGHGRRAFIAASRAARSRSASMAATGLSLRLTCSPGSLFRS